MPVLLCLCVCEREEPNINIVLVDSHAITAFLLSMVMELLAQSLAFSLRLQMIQINSSDVEYHQTACHDSIWFAIEQIELNFVCSPCTIKPKGDSAAESGVFLARAALDGLKPWARLRHNGVKAQS